MIKDLLSIIIPAYNASSSIGRLLDSILIQDYPDFEVIVIDDGSKDNTLEVLKEYAKKDHRIKAYHKENGGVSKARNYALDRISGEYLMFLDADDYLEEGILSSSINELCTFNVDMVIFSWMVHYTNSTKTKIPDIGKPGIYKAKMVRKEIAIEDIKMGGGYPWNRITKVTNNLPRFDESLNTYEDKLWIMKVLKDSTSVYLSKNVGYHYIVSPKSLSHHITVKKALNYLKALEKIKLALISTNDFTKSLSLEFQIIVTKTLFTIFRYERHEFDKIADNFKLYFGLHNPNAFIESHIMQLHINRNKQN